ncbi:MAG TPA: hypothetical protein ENF41_03405 [Candidatus Bathyarchaeota archaeon]|nr:hypothetical protein [Candidatus Bathyarchaeota archaeon]
MRKKKIVGRCSLCGYLGPSNIYCDICDRWYCIECVDSPQHEEIDIKCLEALERGLRGMKKC